MFKHIRPIDQPLSYKELRFLAFALPLFGLAVMAVGLSLR